MSRYIAGSRTAAVDVLTWFLFVTSALSVLIRLGTKIWIFRILKRDDYFSILSLIFCAAQSISMTIATVNGYGQHQIQLTGAQADSIMKSQYAADIFFVASMCFSKLALVTFVRGLTMVILDRRLSLALEILIGAWTIIGIFGIAFACRLPYPWDYLHQQCFNRAAWLSYLGISNIVTDTAILAQAIVIIIRLRTNIQKKAILTSVFAFRLLVPASIIAQLVFTSRSVRSSDPSFETAPVVITIEFCQSLSIVTSCAPQLKPFLDSLQSTGMYLNGMTRSYKSSASNSYGRTNRSGAAIDYHAQRMGSFQPPSRDGNHTVVTANKRDWDMGSLSSQTQIIRETRTWMVTEAPRSPRSMPVDSL